MCKLVHPLSSDSPVSRQPPNHVSMPIVRNPTSSALNPDRFDAVSLNQLAVTPPAEVMSSLSVQPASASAGPSAANSGSAANTGPQATTSEQRSDSIQLANGKVRIGTLLYADYSYYTKTGFGPQFVSQINPPGPGNNSYNTFEINRAYLNVYYSPSDTFTFRLTPELYRQIGTAPAAK